MIGTQGVAGLGFAAADVAAGRTQTEVERTATFLAAVSLACRGLGGNVVGFGGGSGSGQSAEDVHGATVATFGAEGCEEDHAPRRTSGERLQNIPIGDLREALGVADDDLVVGRVAQPPLGGR